MFWTPKTTPKTTTRKPNRYLFGENVFAEWRECDEKSHKDGEGWAFYILRPLIEKSDPAGIPSIFSAGFNTDTDENAKALLDKLDPGFAPNE